MARCEPALAPDRRGDHRRWRRLVVGLHAVPDEQGDQRIEGAVASAAVDGGGEPGPGKERPRENGQPVLRHLARRRGGHAPGPAGLRSGQVPGRHYGSGKGEWIGASADAGRYSRAHWRWVSVDEEPDDRG